MEIYDETACKAAPAIPTCFAMVHIGISQLVVVLGILGTGLSLAYRKFAFLRRAPRVMKLQHVSSKNN